MGRWNNSAVKRSAGKPARKTSTKVSSPMHAIKRGLASLFVCALVITPLILTIIQWTNAFGLKFSLKGLL